jgi:hypothetical protein
VGGSRHRCLRGELLGIAAADRILSQPWTTEAPNRLWSLDAKQ